MNQTIQFVLASQSPRRKELLERLGVCVSVITSDVSEEISSEDPVMVTRDRKSVV